MEVVEKMKQSGFAAVEKDIAPVIAHFRAKNSARGGQRIKPAIKQGTVHTLYFTCKNFILRSPLFTAERIGNVFIGISPVVASELLKSVLPMLEWRERNQARMARRKRFVELMMGAGTVREITLPGPLLSKNLIQIHRDWLFFDLLKCFPNLKALKIGDECSAPKKFGLDCLSCLATLEVLRLPTANPINLKDLLLFRSLRDLECSFLSDVQLVDAGQVIRLQRLVILSGPKVLNATKLAQLVAVMPELQKLDCLSVLLKYQDYGKVASELVSALGGRKLLLERLELHGRHVPSIWAPTLGVEFLKVVGPLSKDFEEKLRSLAPVEVRCLDIDSVQPLFFRTIMETFGKIGLKKLVISAESTTIMRQTRRQDGQYDYLEYQELDLSPILAAAPGLEIFCLDYGARLNLSVGIGVQALQCIKQFYICPEALAKVDSRVLEEIYKNFLHGAATIRELKISPPELKIVLELLKSKPEWGLSLKEITFVELPNEKSLLLAFEVGALLVLRRAQIEVIDFSTVLGNYGRDLLDRLKAMKYYSNNQYWYNYKTKFEPTWFWDLLRAVGVSSKVSAHNIFNGLSSFKVV